MGTITIANKKALPKQRLDCIKKFLYYFPKGFTDPKYIDWERNYKWEAHLAWEEQLNKEKFEALLSRYTYEEICLTAVRIESRTNLLFSFEKMALRDAVKTLEGAKSFALGLYDYIYGSSSLPTRFEKLTNVIAHLRRIQTRVLTWPLQSVFGFIGNPKEHLFYKPRVTQVAALKYGFDLAYRSRPNFNNYQLLLDFAQLIKKDLVSLEPRDMIDLQSFIWVMGSDEYPD